MSVIKLSDSLFSPFLNGFELLASKILTQEWNLFPKKEDIIEICSFIQYIFIKRILGGQNDARGWTCGD